MFDLLAFDTDAFSDEAFLFDESGAAVEPAGGHYWPTEKERKKKRKDYREDRDREREEDRQEVRRLLEQASGLVEQVKESADEPAMVQQVERIETELKSIEDKLGPSTLGTKVDLKAIQATLDLILARFVDSVIERLIALIEELQREIDEESRK